MRDAPSIALVWDDATRLGGVNTWLFQCVDRMPSRGLDVWIADFGAAESGQVDITPWRHRVLRLRQGPWESAAGFRSRVRRSFASRGIRAVVFQEHRFGEDVLACLPAGFPAANVLHVDRPDDRYYALACALDPALDEQYAVSPRIRDNLRARLPASRRDRVHFLPLGVSLPAEAPAPRRLDPGQPWRLVYAGRLAREQKRVQDIAPFLRELDRLGEPWRMDIYGGGPDEAWLRQDLASFAGRATLHGSRPQSEVLQALENAHILLLFSDFEGLPLVLLEAMARRAVPLVTRVPSGVSDLLRDDRDACLFTPGEPAAAAARLTRLRTDPARYATLAQAARATAEGYDLERCLDAYAERLLALARRTPGPAAPDRPSPGRSLRARLADRLPRRLLEIVQCG